MPAANDIRVLIVDDDVRFADALTARLEGEGLRVVGYAPDGAEGLEAAAAVGPAVVTMDVELPLMDGVEATRAITALGIPVVVITGSHPDRVGEAVAAGAAATVAKAEVTHVLAPLLRAVAHR